jgi:23S rRNA pseudouridine1911/1915/1917 synthase
MEQELERVDKLVKTIFSGLSRRQVEEAIESGLVIGPDGARLKKGDRIAAEGLDCHRLAEQLVSLARGDGTLPVRKVSEEADFVVADKPAGMPSEPHSLFDFRTITQWAVARFPDVKQDFPQPQPMLTPHPLDPDSAGLVVIAKNKKGFDLWRDRFDRREVSLSYLAWCWGEPKQHRFFVSAPLAQTPGDLEKRIVAVTGTQYDPPARDAVTVVRIVDVIKRPGGAGFFLAEIQSITNVPHQVRVHMASKGHPLLGDRLYDSEFETRAEKPAQYQLMVFQMEYGGRRYVASPSQFKSRYGNCEI